SVFSGLLATAWAQVGVQSRGQSDDENAELVSGNYFDVLGAQPALGRLFIASDDLVQDANPVAVLSFSYWRRRFGLDPGILNQAISINGNPFTVIGITAPGFHSAVQGDSPALFVPMTMKHEIARGKDSLEERRSQWLNIIGRLKPGIARKHAQAGIEPVWQAI